MCAQRVVHQGKAVRQESVVRRREAPWTIGSLTMRGVHEPGSTLMRGSGFTSQLLLTRDLFWKSWLWSGSRKCSSRTGPQTWCETDGRKERERNQ